MGGHHASAAADESEAVGGSRQFNSALARLILDVRADRVLASAIRFRAILTPRLREFEKQAIGAYFLFIENRKTGHGEDLPPHASEDH